MIDFRARVLRASWPTRLAIYAILYVVYVAVAIVFVKPVIDQIDNRLPDVFFYHMHEGEPSGPIGDPRIILTAVGSHCLLFLMLFVPLAAFFGLPVLAIVILGIISEPLIFALLVNLRSMVDGLAWPD